MKNIILYGMRGTGKSTIGKNLALKLGKIFIDLDEYIEEKVGKNLAIFIEENGWDRFREIEHLCLKEVLNGHLNDFKNKDGSGNEFRMTSLDGYNSSGLILALGGGTIIFPRNQKLILKNNSKLIYIYSNLEEIAKRIEKDEKKGNKRNSLTGKSTLEELEEVYVERKEIYERFYDFQVINNGNIENTIFEIEKNLKKGNICVPITNFENIENQIEIINNSRKIKFVELRIDFLDDLQKLDEIISKIDKQIILTNRTEKEGGKFAGTAKENFEVLSKYFSKVEYVDFEIPLSPTLSPQRRKGEAFPLQIGEGLGHSCLKPGNNGINK